MKEESKMAKPRCLQVFLKHQPSFLGDQNWVLGIKSSLPPENYMEWLYLILKLQFVTESNLKGQCLLRDISGFSHYLRNQLPDQTSKIIFTLQGKCSNYIRAKQYLE